jgi:hypothetical protein
LGVLEDIPISIMLLVTSRELRDLSLSPLGKAISPVISQTLRLEERSSHLADSVISLFPSLALRPLLETVMAGDLLHLEIPRAEELVDKVINMMSLLLGIRDIRRLRSTVQGDSIKSAQESFKTRQIF